MPCVPPRFIPCLAPVDALASCGSWIPAPLAEPANCSSAKVSKHRIKDFSLLLRVFTILVFVSVLSSLDCCLSCHSWVLYTSRHEILIIRCTAMQCYEIAWQRRCSCKARVIEGLSIQGFACSSCHVMKVPTENVSTSHSSLRSCNCRLLEGIANFIAIRFNEQDARPTKKLYIVPQHNKT
jgi:hypothetical protein